MRLGSIGPTELILMLLILVLIFGAGKLASVGGALGKSVKDFKRTSREDEGDEVAAVAPARPAVSVTEASAPPPITSAQPPPDTQTR